MEKFNLKRFYHTLSWLFISKWKNALSTFIGAFLAFLVIEVLFINVMFGKGSVDVTMSFIFFIIIIYMYVGANKMFATLNSKQHRITYLVHPASHLEKCLSRYIYYVIIWFICLLVALVCADSLRVLFSSFIGGSTQSGLPYILEPHFMSVYSEGGKNLITPERQIMSFIWIHSLFMLGGVFFRRHGFLFTACAMCIFSFSVTLIVVAYLGENVSNSEKILENLFTPTLNTVCFNIDAFLIVFNYVATYFVFKRMQVINNKWINI